MTPTPRGGGIGIVVAFGTAILVLRCTETLAPNRCMALLGGGLLVAAVGILDDRFRIPAPIRLITHFAAASWALHCLGGSQAIHLGPVAVSGRLATVLWVLGIVWIVNLTNFMDGTDGLVASGAVSVLCGAGSIAVGAGDSGIGFACWSLGAACSGFLLLNWHPARIFMGDVGSGFLGFCLGVLALSQTSADPAAFSSWVVFLAVFWCDASITLIRRAVRGERVIEAHRSHAYQHAAHAWGSIRVVLGILVLQFGWILPLGYLSYRLRAIAPLVVLIACMPITALAVIFGAGTCSPTRRIGSRQRSNESQIRSWTTIPSPEAAVSPNDR